MTPMAFCGAFECAADPDGSSGEVGNRTLKPVVGAC